MATTGILHILKKDWSPNVKPDHIGQHWIDRTAKRQWLASGTSSLTDWTEIVGTPGASPGVVRVDRILNVAAFAVYTPTQPNAVVETLGFYDLADGGHASYYIDENDTTTAGDGRTVFPIADGRRAKLRQKDVNVRQIGAKGDGTTDDTAAIQAAINYVASRGPGTIFLPSGTYVVTSIIPQSNIVIAGLGTTSVIKKKAGDTSHIIINTTLQHFTLRDLAIDGNKSNCNQGSAMVLSGNNITVENCYIHDTPDAGILLGYFSGLDTGNYRIINNYLFNCSKVGNAYGGIGVTSGKNVVLHGNHIVCDDGGSHYGIDIETNGGPAADCGNMIVSDNVMVGGGLHVDFVQSTGGKVECIKLVNNIVDCRGGFDNGFDTMTPFWCRNFKSFKISGNTVYQHDTSDRPYGGVYCWDLAEGEIEHNTFYVREIPARDNYVIFFDPAHPSNDIQLSWNRFICTSGVVQFGIFCADPVTNLWVRQNQGTNIGTMQSIDGADLADWSNPTVWTSPGPITSKFRTSVDTDARLDFETWNGAAYVRQGSISWHSDELLIDADTELKLQTATTDRLTIAANGEIAIPGRLGIGTAPTAVAALDITSTTKVFIPPRMTEAQRDALSPTPPSGSQIYNTTTDKLQVRSAGAWVDLH